jgi:hypothetical protein
MVCGRAADREFQAGRHRPGPSRSPARPACSADADLTRLPLIDRAQLFDLLTADVAGLDRPAGASDLAAIAARLFGQSPAPQQIVPQNGETIAQAYRRIIDSDAFRAACGRIAASYAW